jgi:hypothetical protein
MWHLVIALICLITVWGSAVCITTGGDLRGEGNPKILENQRKKQSALSHAQGGPIWVSSSHKRSNWQLFFSSDSNLTLFSKTSFFHQVRHLRQQLFFCQMDQGEKERFYRIF